MKVTLDLKNVKVTEVTKDDKDKVLSITIEPEFASAVGSAVCLTGETSTSKGRKIEEFTVNVNGKTGKLSLDKNEAGVTVPPKIDADDPPPAPPGAQGGTPPAQPRTTLPRGRQ